MKSLFSIACLFLLVFFVNSLLMAQENKVARIKVVENKFLDENGNEFVFRGLNTSDPAKLLKDGHWDKAYFQEMKNWGANIIRLPVHPTAWRELGQEKYLALLDQAAEWAAELDLYVIIDWHVIGNLRTEMYQAPMYETTQKETFEFWRTISKHFKGNHTMAFYEIFNEPTTFVNQLGTCSWDQWKALVEEMITIIRANGATAVPLVAGWNWAYDLTEVKKDPINAEGIAYVSHPYPQKRDKPWEDKWTTDWGFAAGKYPVILTEIGFCYANERGAHIPVISDESYGDAITAYCKERGISWVAWVFDPQWSPMLIYDWSYKPTPQGTYFKNAMLE